MPNILGPDYHISVFSSTRLLPSLLANQQVLKTGLVGAEDRSCSIPRLANGFLSSLLLVPGAKSIDSESSNLSWAEKGVYTTHPEPTAHCFCKAPVTLTYATEV